METKVYTYKDLIKIYILQKQYAQAAKPLQEYYARLYKHLKNFFGTDLDALEQREGYGAELTGLDSLFRCTLECYCNTSSPFDCLIEVPKPISVLYETHGILLNDRMASYKEACFALLCDIYCTMFGKNERKISSQELNKLGFNDSEEPDPLDYL